MILAFDFDGTLVDTMPSLSSLGISTLMSFYGMEHSHAYAAYLSTVGMSFPDQLEELFPGDSRNADAASYFWDGHFSTYANLQVAFPGVKDALQKLIDDGHIIWIVTSSPEGLVARAARRTLPLDARVLGRGYGTKVEQLKKCKATIFFGDTPRDMTYAEEAGVDFVGVGPYWGRDPSQVISRLAGEVLELRV